MKRIVNMAITTFFKLNIMTCCEPMPNRAPVRQTRVRDCLLYWCSCADNDSFAGEACPHGDKCIYGHVCPNGPTCGFKAEGRCWFTGKGMHNVSTS